MKRQFKYETPAQAPSFIRLNHGVQSRNNKTVNKTHTNTTQSQVQIEYALSESGDLQGYTCTTVKCSPGLIAGCLAIAPGVLPSIMTVK
ncbi:UNVERIFIED_CONTAM: hypothetical protein FKN15_007296 [Acipenser sinensis]